MFGNQLTEEQRQNGLLMVLGIDGVAGAAKVADKVRVVQSSSLTVRNLRKSRFRRFKP
jgi:hypothetical protein